MGSGTSRSNPFFQQQHRKRYNRSSSSSISDWDALQRDQQQQQQEVDLKLSLEELYNGVTKKLKVTRHVFDSNGRPAQQPTQEVLEVQVKPGWKEGRSLVTAVTAGDCTSQIQVAQSQHVTT